jgi:hypothetical protein
VYGLSSSGKPAVIDQPNAGEGTSHNSAKPL